MKRNRLIIAFIALMCACALFILACDSVQPVKITFDANGGTGDGYTQSVNVGEATALDLNKFTKTDYSFNGWNTAADGSGTAYTDGETITLITDIVLYAQWKADTEEPEEGVYTVTFKANGGTGSDYTQNIEENTSAALTANLFTKAGHSFTGWNTAANGSGTAYGAGADYAMGEADVILFAQWTANTYTVTFKPNGGTGADFSDDFTYGEAAGLPANPFTAPEGMEFGGWCVNANGTGTKYAAGASYTLTTEGGATLYACWQAPISIIDVTKAYDAQTDYMDKTVGFFKRTGECTLNNTTEGHLVLLALTLMSIVTMPFYARLLVKINTARPSRDLAAGDDLGGQLIVDEEEPEVRKEAKSRDV